MEESKLSKKLYILLGIFVLVFVGCCYYAYQIFFAYPIQESDKDDLASDVKISEVGNQKKPEEIADTNQTSVTLNEYKSFVFDDMDFNFIIAKVHVKSNQPINIPLSHFVTSENISLDNVSTYVTKLEEKSYFLGRQNVLFHLISTDTEMDANIFIPVQDKQAKEITVAVDIGKQQTLKFKLEQAKGTKEMLFYQAEDIITDGKTYQMQVFEALEITGDTLVKKVGNIETDYMLPSTTKVYAFGIDAVSLWGDSIVIDKAEYVPNNTKETFTAMDQSIQSARFNNLIGQEIKDKQHGYLLFYAYDPIDHPVTYKGVLKLTIQGSNIPIVINVDLN